MVLARFLPQDERFFQLFADAARNADDAAHLLVEIFTTTEDLERKMRRMRDLEHMGDEITHQLFNALNRTFVTPLDREDIRDLASKLDDFVDYMDEAAKRFLLYRIGAPNALSGALARIIAEQAAIILTSVPMLEQPKKQDELLRYTVEINRLENEGDTLLTEALSGLYDNVVDIPALIQAIRWGEIYQLLEDATDRAEDVANTMEGIALKHA